MSTQAKHPAQIYQWPKARGSAIPQRRTAVAAPSILDDSPLPYWVYLQLIYQTKTGDDGVTFTELWNYERKRWDMVNLHDDLLQASDALAYCKEIFTDSVVVCGTHGWALNLTGPRPCPECFIPACAHRNARKRQPSSSNDGPSWQPESGLGGYEWAVIGFMALAAAFLFIASYFPLAAN